MDIYFQTYIPKWISPGEFAAFVRVYDQFGHAHETEFVVSVSFISATPLFPEFKILKERPRQSRSLALKLSAAPFPPVTYPTCGVLIFFICVVHDRAQP
jgi:hypothetical protein